MKTQRNNSNRPQAILLDFYGTVVAEDDVPISQICRLIAESSSRSPTHGEVGYYWWQQFSQLCYESNGPSFRTQKDLELISLQRVLQHFTAELDAKVLSEVLYGYWRRPAILPESKTVLAQCNVPICLVSNIDNAELNSALRHNGLSFESVVTSEDCRAYKPRTEMFEKALAMLGMTANEVLCVGDSLTSDVRGARELDMPVLWINRKRRPVPSGDLAPDYVSNDLTAVLDILSGKMRS